MEYKILEATERYELQGMVNEYLSKGWVLVGGVCMAGNAFNYMYLQAVSYQEARFGDE